MPTAQVDRLYREGVAAVRAGDKETARQKLMAVIEQEETHEQAWLWLSAAVETKEDRITCLQNALTINPANEQARKGLYKLGVSDDDMPPLPEPPQPPEPVLTDEIWGAQPPVPAPPPPQSPPSSMRMEHAAPRFLEESEREKWERERRQHMYDEAQGGYDNDAKYVLHGDVPERDILELPNAWVQLAIFNPLGDFAAEVEHPNFIHILANLSVASIFQIIAAILAVVLIVQTSIVQAQQFYVNPSAAPDSALLTGSEVLLGVNPVTLIATTLVDAANEAGTTVNDLTGELGDLITGPGLITFIAVTAIGTLLGVFLGQFFRGWVASWVCGFVGGKGDVINTTMALSTAFVVTSLARLIMVPLIPFLPILALGLIGFGLGIYTWILEGMALARAQKFGVLAGMGMVILTNSASSFISGIASFCLLTVLPLILG